jgi:hypothetical protein
MAGPEAPFAGEADDGAGPVISEDHFDRVAISPTTAND